MYRIPGRPPTVVRARGRPVWKTLPIGVGVTAAVGLMLNLSALIVLFTGNVA